MSFRKHAILTIKNTGAGFNHRIIPAMIPRLEPCIIDAGANYGYFTQRILQLLDLLNPRFFLIECQKSLLDDLERNITSLDIRSVIIKKALVGSETKYKVKFTEFIGETKNNGLYRFHQWGNIYGSNQPEDDHVKKEYEVECLTLLKLINSYNIYQIDYLKMDVEGAEEEIIKTLTPDLAKRISQMSFEYHNNNPHQYIKILKSLDFNTVIFQRDKEIFAYRPN